MSVMNWIYKAKICCFLINHKKADSTYFALPLTLDMFKILPRIFRWILLEKSDVIHEKRKERLALFSRNSAVKEKCRQASLTFILKENF